VIYLFDGMMEYPSSIALHLLQRFSKQYITVSLTGEGADELFGGYNKFRTVAKLCRAGSPTPRIPSGLFRFQFPERVAHKWIRPLYLRNTYSGRPWSILDQLNSFVSLQGMKETIGAPKTGLLDSFDHQRLGAFQLERQMLVLDHMTYLYNLCDHQDRNSMGASIESRLPFLDRALVEWAMCLDPQELFDEEENKKPLRTLAADLFGESFAYRPKMGFPMPLPYWLTDPLCFGPMYHAMHNEDFLLYQKVDRNRIVDWLGEKRFDNRLLNYPNSERMELAWYLTGLRTAQDVFRIKEIRD
jgi:asparagine synthase (glutamine-hydrolysing)